MHTHLRQRLVLAAIITIVVGLLYSAGVFSNLQVRLADSLYGGRQAADNIIIVAIDDKSLQEIGRWPWDREVYAELLPMLNGSAVIGIDVAFFETSTPEADAALIDAVRKAGNVIVPREFTSFTAEGRGKDVLEPIPGLAQAAAGVGYVNVLTDRDGVTRAVQYGISGYPAFSKVIAGLYAGREIDVPQERALINFVGKQGSFTTIPATDVINGRVSAGMFDGAIVLIGATAPDLHDDHIVPTSQGKAMPGVEVHANTIQMLLTGTFLKEESAFLVWLSIIFFSLIVLFLSLIPRMWVGAVLTLALIVLYAFITIWLFSSGVILNIVHVIIGGVFTYVGSVALAYVVERKEKAHVTAAFGKYVSPLVVDELLKHPEKLNLGGEKRTITIFFSDIRGFTTLSEKLQPEELVHFLNEYLSAMTSIVLKHKGLVDKYIGDAIMAFWGAPLDEPKHALLACEASLNMMESLKNLKEEWKNKGLPQLDIGIGLNTGDAVIGNMGSFERFDYTAMGDTVNLGSRLEGLNKEYGTAIIISETTHKHIAHEFATRKLDYVKVKGKKVAIEIFELAGKKEDVNEKQKDFIHHYEKGLSLYKQRNWKDAISSFENALALNDDKAAKNMIERCRHYSEHPPAKDWDGSWEMKTK